MAILGLAAVLVAALLYVWDRSVPGDRLWGAMVAVESSGDRWAYCPRTGATGIVQIRATCLADVNRIARDRGLGVQFSDADRYSPARARRMWQLYLEYYGREYWKETGRLPTPEVYARMWYGGPDGWRKSCTVEYWRRVRRAMDGES
jgi:hypothetical protein